MSFLGVVYMIEHNADAIVNSARTLHREIPIRLARRIVDLENLPDSLPDTPAIVQLRESLIKSFDEMLQYVFHSSPQHAFHRSSACL